MCTLDRRAVFVDAVQAMSACEELLRTSADYQFEIIAYCLMPDHLHVLLNGLADDADFRRFVSMYKQRTGFRYRKRTTACLWQEGYFEHVLRADEDIVGVAAYVVANPIRAGLCGSPTEYPYLSSPAYSLESLIDAVQIRPGSRP